MTLARAPGPRPGRWLEERYGHTATLLPDGRVLVAGGVHCPLLMDPKAAPSLTAELFNPATGTWQATGSMDDARHRHTATLLRNGRVLVAGGLSDNPPDGDAESLPSAELYDPPTGTWTDTGPMHLRRGIHTASLLPSGLVLIAGGNRKCTRSETGLASAELFRPSERGSGR